MSWESSAHVYVVHAGNTDWYKIGVTKREPSTRLSQIQTGNPYRLRVHLGVWFEGKGLAMRIEAMLHRALADSRGAGEWFQLSADEIIRLSDWLKRAGQTQTVCPMGQFESAPRVRAFIRPSQALSQFRAVA